MIPYSRQNIDAKDINSLVKVLKSDWLTQGPNINDFENAVKNIVKAKYACAVNSATSGLHLACLALDIKKGDIVWTTPNTFVSSANCVIYCGGTIGFIDIDPSTLNICIKELEIKLKVAKKNKKLPKVIISVHFAGQPTNQEKIWELAKKYNFKIIEDASHSLGAYRKNEPVGSCRWSHLTILSFHAVKIITTGEGGMVLTNNKSYNKKIIKLRSHGITRNIKDYKNKNIGAWYYEQQNLGFNYRMTDFQAALGISQIAKLKLFTKKRIQIAKVYNKELLKLPIKLPEISKYNKSSWHLYVIRIQLDKIKKSHKQVFNFLRKNGINVNLHYIPVHTHPFYINMGFKKNDFPESIRYADEAISLPMHTKITKKELNYIILNLKKALQ